MTKQRRQTLARFVEWGAVGLVLLDVVLYLVVARPLAQDAAAEKRERNRLQSQIRLTQASVDRLESLRASLPQTEENLALFLKDHVPTRQRGFSRAAGLVRQLAEDSGVALSSPSYRLEVSTDEPFERLGIKVTVEGSLSEVLRFAHGLETSDDLVVVHDFTFQPGETSGLALRVGAELYLTP